MTRRTAFGRSALFAAVAAAGWPVWALCSFPTIDWWAALALYLAAISGLYIGGLLPGRAGGAPAFPRPRTGGSIGAARRLIAALLGIVAAMAVASWAHNTRELAIGLAALLGIARSGFIYRATPVRAVAIELTLLVGGLLFARFLAGPSLVSSALALWGFLLVQSIFFLIPGVRPRTVARSVGDPFDEAHRRALALLERSQA
jgi:hypothetical protein